MANPFGMVFSRQVVDVVIETSFPHLKDLSEQDRYLVKSEHFRKEVNVNNVNFD